jgi:uncharacterized glyoxalase superfamily protein PhnB
MPKNPPQGWPTISSAIFYQDASAAIAWLVKVLGFETRLRVDGSDGSVLHSELTLGDGVIMVASGGRPARKSPREVGGANTQTLFVYVNDVDAHFARARAAGASIVSELETKSYGDDYGTNRSYELEDLDGHHWWFAQRL